MRSPLVAAFGLALILGMPAGSFAQSPDTTHAPSKSRRATAKPAREPTAGQMAARERQKKCGAEWKDAKAKGTTGGLKWPQYWSKCNARLKGGGQA